MEDVYKHLNLIYTELRPSNIHGVGYHAFRKIEKGTEVFKPWKGPTDYYKVYILDSRIGLELRTFILKYFINVNDNVNILLINGLNFSTPWRHYVNHVTYPNLTSTGVALQNIEIGEEIIRNYYNTQEQIKTKII